MLFFFRYEENNQINGKRTQKYDFRISEKSFKRRF